MVNSIAPKVDLRTNDTRQRIMQEARHLYEIGGYSHLSMDKIAETLGLKRPTLYYHFPGGKNQLLAETITTFTTDLLILWSRSIADGPTARTRLRNILATVVDYPLPENKWNVFIELWQLDDEIRAAITQSYHQIFALLGQVFEEGIAQGEIRPVEVELAIRSFMAIYDQIENLIATKRYVPELGSIANTLEIDVLMDTLFDLWMGGIQGPAPTQT